MTEIHFDSKGNYESTLTGEFWRSIPSKETKELTDEEWKQIESGHTLTELEEEKNKIQIQLKNIYFTIKDILKEYCDLKEEYYTIIPLWIIGTYFHQNFPSYPYLFLNATKGGGKSRTMSLIITLSSQGAMLNSLTEAVLFRTKGTLGIDEFEGIERKEMSALKELLNSAYKKGVKVKRMKKKKSSEGEEQVVEEFEVYRPIVMANIRGIENVLSDRCIQLILEKSDKKEITRLIEIFREDPFVKELLLEMEVLSKNIQCRLCSVVSLWNIYKEWNAYVKNNNTNDTYITNNINNTNDTNLIKNEYFSYKNVFEVLKKTEISGRDLELCFPLLLISAEISDEVLKETTLVLQEMMVTKREEEFTENYDIALIDFVGQLGDIEYFKTVNQLTTEFRTFVSCGDEWLNNKWVGRALKRLDLIKQKRRVGNRGNEVILDVPKAQSKIKMFK